MNSMGSCNKWNLILERFFLNCKCLYPKLFVQIYFIVFLLNPLVCYNVCHVSGLCMSLTQ